jgi:hypothetical protein
MARFGRGQTAGGRDVLAAGPSRCLQLPSSAGGVLCGTKQEDTILVIGFVVITFISVPYPSHITQDFFQRHL